MLLYTLRRDRSVFPACDMKAATHTALLGESARGVCIAFHCKAG